MKIARLSSLLFVLALAAAAFCFDPATLAGNPNSQNTNSSTTMMENTNKAKPSRARGRRHRRRAAAAAAETATTPTEESTETTAGPTEQTDLSGTYSGTFDCSDAGVSGETTLTVTGNQFTLADGKSGRIVAATTRGYTGATMQFGEFTIPAPGQAAGASPVIVSMRAKKSGDRLTLTPIAGEKHVCSFTPAGASRGARMRHRRGRAATPAAAAEPATPAETMAPAEPATAPTPTSRRRGRRGRRGNENTNTNSNTNMNDNTGEANPSPTATPAIPRN